MSHSCSECGGVHDAPVVETPDVVVEAPPTEAVVAVAEIEATRDVKLAQINAGTEEAWRDSRIAGLEGEINGMKEMLERLLPPEPDPAADAVPIVVEAPAEEPVIDTPAAEPPPITEPAATKKKGNAWW